MALESAVEEAERRVATSMVAAAYRGEGLGAREGAMTEFLATL